MTNDALEHITHMRNLDNSVESFTHLITAVINKVLPEKTLRVKQNSLPWAREPEVCEARIKRNLAHWKAIKCNTPEAWSNYTKLRNKATAVLRSAKSSYYYHLAGEMKIKPHRFRKQFHHLSSKSTPTSSPLPSHTASDFNRHFLNVAPNIIKLVRLVQHRT